MAAWLLRRRACRVRGIGGGGGGGNINIVGSDIGVDISRARSRDNRTCRPEFGTGWAYGRCCTTSR